MMVDKRIIIGLLLFVSLIWLIFFPKFLANVDEHNYLRTAWKISHLESVEESSLDQSLGGFQNNADKYISKYNLGNSILLAPLTIFAWQPAFLLGLASYVGIIWIFYLLLKKYSMSNFWIILLIIYPPFIFFSRTILSELPAAFLLLTSYYLATKSVIGPRSIILLGAVMGLLVLVRYNLALWVLLLVGYMVWKKLLTKSNIGWLVVAGMPFLLIFLLVNLHLYGSVLSSGYKFSGEEVLNISLLSERLPAYILNLNILYPFMFLLLPFSRLNGKWLVMIVSTLLLAFYSVAGGFLFEGQPTDLIVGIRFFIPIIPLVLLHYFSILNPLITNLPKYWITRLVVICVMFGSISTVGISWVHQKFLLERSDTFSAIRQLDLQTKRILFVGDEEDYIYLGEQFESKFDESGYLSVKDFRTVYTNEDYLKSYNKIILIKSSYTTRTDRPTAAMVELIEELLTKTKLIEVYKTSLTTIYEYKYEPNL